MGIVKFIFRILPLFMITTGLAQLTITGEVRPRFEYRDGFKTFNSETTDPAAFVEQRSRVGINFKKDQLQFKVSVQDVRLWGGTSQIYKTDNASLLNLNEAWAAYTFDYSSTIKVGRQELNYDNARFLGNLGWAQQSRSHDLIKFEYAGEDKFSYHIGAAFNQEFVNANPEPARLASTFYSGVNNYKTMQFLWMNKKYESGNFSFLFLSNGTQAPDSTTRFSFTSGIHWKQKLGGLDLKTEGYYQFGEDPQARTLSAYLLSLEVSKKLEKSSLLIGGDLLSGTTPGEADNNSFNPLYGTNHKFYGLMDYFYVGNSHGNIGLLDLYLKSKINIGEKSDVSIHIHQFSTPVDMMATDGTSASSSLGQEIDLIYNKQLATGVNLKIGFSALEGTETLALVKSGNSKTLNYWGWTMITFKPTLFTNADN